MNRLKKSLSLLLSVVLAAGCISCVPFTAGAESANSAQKNTVSSSSAAAAADNELIVTFDENVSERKIEAVAESASAEVESITEIGAIKIAAVSTEQNMVQSAQELSENRYVQSVQPNYKYTPAADDPMISSDTYAMNQYQFEATHAMEAWSELESGTHGKTRVAVIDTGVDAAHEDLQKNLLLSAGKYTHFEYGEQMQASDDYDEADGHGTHVSGIIGATYGNNLGGAGLAAGHHNDLIELMCIGASADGYGLYTIDIVKAIAYAARNGAKVINLSFSSNTRDLVLDAAIRDAYYHDNVVFVGASGNEESDKISYPADLKEVISVTASGRDNAPTYYSNYGVEKDVAAPGNSIPSTLPGDDYGVLSGTSMASPVTAAIAALVLDANPNLTPAQVYNILCAGAKQPENVATRFDTTTGYGIIDAAAAVKAAKAARADTAVEQISVKSDEIEMFVGSIYGAEALVQPATALAPIHWSIEDNTIARIDAQTGNITALKAGTTVITASAGGKSVSQSLKVKPAVDVSNITVSGIPENGEMAAGYAVYLDIKVEPSNATYTDYYLESSNPNVLGAFEGGELIAFATGTATVSVKGADGTVYKQFTITVKNEAYEVAITSAPAWVMLGTTAKCTAKCLDAYGGENVANNAITYRSGNKNIFRVDAASGVITPVATGKAFVIASNAFSGEFDAKQITVVKTAYGSADYALKQTARTKDSITLSWNAIPVASGYKIERKDSASGAWKTVVTLAKNATTYRQIKLTAGKVYYYRVTAVADKKYSGKITASTAPACTTTPNYKLKQSAKTKTSITLSWSKVPDAAGYYVQYRTNTKAAWKNAKLVGAKTLKYTHTRLKANQTVYYRVLATYKVGTSVRYFEVSPSIKAKTAW